MKPMKPMKQVIDGNFEPKTELGKKLVSIRKEAIANGIRLLSADEVLEEVRKRRERI
jgi:topoisomerase IA-like protein